MFGLFEGKKPEFVCEDCGTVTNKPKETYRGSFIIAVLLLILGIIPGLIYLMWNSGMKKMCPACGSEHLINAETPRGRKLAAQYKE